MFSKFAKQFARQSGTKQLMDDLGAVVNSPTPVINLGGGNPGHVEAVHRVFTEQLSRSLKDHTIDGILARYDDPRGHLPFRKALARLLNNTYGWPLNVDNIAITAGSQASFFMLFNSLAGEFDQGEFKRVMLPLAPEYIGYRDVGIVDGMIAAKPARIERREENLFKYRLDFEQRDVGSDIGVVCVSRPTNPTGNVLTNDEIERLIDITRAKGVPFIIDGAYGLPFPNIVFTEATPVWDEHVILCLSLSKIGLPGLRTGIVIANPDIVDVITSMNAIFTLANSSLGAHLAEPLVSDGGIIELAAKQVKPFYENKARQAIGWCHESFTGVEYCLHEAEGAIFLWVWFPGLPISDQMLYERLKRRGVLVLPGRHFFPADTGDSKHAGECLRISYAQDPKDVREGIRIIGEEVRKAYDSG